MRPSSLGGDAHCVALCLSVCLSVRPVIVAIGHVFSATLASRMYFSARTDGRISYGHLGRTDSCLFCFRGDFDLYQLTFAYFDLISTGHILTSSTVKSSSPSTRQMTPGKYLFFLHTSLSMAFHHNTQGRLSLPNGNDPHYPLPSPSPPLPFLSPSLPPPSHFPPIPSLPSPGVWGQSPQ